MSGVGHADLGGWPLSRGAGYARLGFVTTEGCVPRQGQGRSFDKLRTDGVGGRIPGLGMRFREKI